MSVLRQQTRKEQGARMRSMYLSLGMNRAACAKFLHVTERTLHNWESGQHAIPYTAYKLLRLHASYELPGKAWHGWLLHSGKLWTPEGHGLTPADVHCWYNLARRAHLFSVLLKENDKLKAALRSAAAPAEGASLAGEDSAQATDAGRGAGYTVHHEHEQQPLDRQGACAPSAAVVPVPLGSTGRTKNDVNPTSNNNHNDGNLTSPTLQGLLPCSHIDFKVTSWPSVYDSPKPSNSAPETAPKLSASPSMPWSAWPWMPTFGPVSPLSSLGQRPSNPESVLPDCHSVSLCPSQRSGSLTPTRSPSSLLTPAKPIEPGWLSGSNGTRHADASKGVLP